MKNIPRQKETQTNEIPIPEIVLFGSSSQSPSDIYQRNRRVVRSITPTIEQTVTQNSTPTSIRIFLTFQLESSAKE